MEERANPNEEDSDENEDPDLFFKPFQQPCDSDDEALSFHPFGYSTSGLASAENPSASYFPPAHKRLWFCYLLRLVTFEFI